MSSVTYMFNVTIILLSNFLETWTNICNDVTYLFGNLPPQVNNHGSQAYEISWILLEQLLFHETLKEKVTWI